MNKLIIPSIFVAVLLVAITFAIMPVEKASTVHTTIIASIGAGSVADRAYNWQLESTAGTTDVILIPAKTNLDLVGRVNVSNLGTAGTCTVEDTGGDAISTAGTGAIDSDPIDSGATPATFAVGEGIRLDVGAGATCSVTIFLDSASE